MSSWRAAVVAVAATHHEIDGAPLYPERFDDVLSFHEPGLAAVRRGSEAWHIDERGEPAYARRFARTFGYYEGLAAVVSDPGWGFIGADGDSVGAHSFGWCGNFQGGRATVRDSEGRYCHVTRELRPVYAARWRYAGDYRHGIAVVQGDAGLSTHIDRTGALTHKCWFEDLDVFHKGFARARNAGGWMHIDTCGEPVYERRFAAVEPFYNGQARVERMDGGLEVIDESGEALTELRPGRTDPFAELSRLLVGHWSTDTIAAAVELGVIEALPAKTAEVAARASLPLGRARRLLRALGELGLVEEHDGAWELRPRGEPLRADHRKTLAGAALEYAGPLREGWRRLPEALRAATWSPPDPFAEAAGDPIRLERAARMLSSYARHDYAPLIHLLPVSPGMHVVDAGGGEGELASALTSLHPGLRVSILERPEIVARVRSNPDPNQGEGIAGNLFSTWSVNADLVLLSRVLHDWDDDDALRILSNARAALNPGGQLALIELLLDERSFGGSLCDMHLLAICGGRERTFERYAALLAEAGFEPPRLQSTPTLPQIVITRPR